MNKIVDQQNSEQCLKYLAAQRVVYSFAKRLLRTREVFIIAIPVILSLLNVFYQIQNPIINIYSLIIIFIDMELFEKIINGKKRNAAIIQELFDNAVFSIQASILPYDNIEPALVEMSAEKIDRYKITNWYDKSIDKLPLEVGRLVCQKMNIWWDCEIRIFQKKVQIGILSIICVSLLIISLIEKMLVEQYVNLLIVMLPYLRYSLKNINDQNSAIKNLEKLKIVDQVIMNVTKTDDYSYLGTTSRIIQDAIFACRTNSPLVSDLLYNISKKKFGKRNMLNTKYIVDGILEKIN
jgi:hypothetical protein